jgi:hypothetical protein
MKTRINSSASLLLILLLVSCSSVTDSPGFIEVYITDHREAIDDFDRLDITIDRIGVHPVGISRAEGWIDFEPDTAVVDLTQVLDGTTAVVLASSLPAGDYDAVRLQIASGEGDLQIGESIIVPGFEQAVRVPFMVRPNTSVEIVIDIVVESEEDHPGGGYEINILSAVID